MGLWGQGEPSSLVAALPQAGHLGGGGCRAHDVGGAEDQERRGVNVAALLRRAVQAEQEHSGSQTVLYTRVPQGWLTLRLQPTGVMLTCSPVSADAAAWGPHFEIRCSK